jgi:hypothetical protein
MEWFTVGGTRRDRHHNGKGLIDRDAAGALTLTDRGRAVLRAMLPDLASSR